MISSPDESLNLDDALADIAVKRGLIAQSDVAVLREQVRLAREAGDSLAGKPVNEATIQEASEKAMAAAVPINDMRGTIRQRVHLVGVLTRRTLNNAIQRARGG